MRIAGLQYANSFQKFAFFL